MEKDNGIRRVKIAVIGVGNRALGLISCLAAMENVEIVALSDLVEERMDQGVKTVQEIGKNTPDKYLNYKDILDREDVEGVIVATSWNEHIEIAIDCMYAGKHCGFEVGGASSIEQCWDLVKAYEKTKTPCMMLENCCYGRYELAVLNMIRQGLFGEVIHCEGGYQHDLRCVAGGLAKDHQRSFHHAKRNGELYPTHEIGPIAKYLDINRGNRFISLTSTASKGRGLDEEAKKIYGDKPIINHRHALGDIVTTVIKCALGETVTIIHDTSLPRPYSRGNAVHGTKAIWMEINNSIYIDGVSPVEGWEHKWEKMDDYLEKYDHPIWKRVLEDGIKGGHGGMDGICLEAFIHSVENKIETPIDVYDAAVWMAITCLSEDSIAMGSSPVAIPDFTNGKWVCRKPVNSGIYSLDD